MGNEKLQVPACLTGYLGIRRGKLRRRDVVGGRDRWSGRAGPRRMILACLDYLVHRSMLTYVKRLRSIRLISKIPSERFTSKLLMWYVVRVRTKYIVTKTH